MKIECFRIGDNGTLERDDAATCLKRWRGGEGRYWIDIEDSTSEERVRWLSVLSLGPLALHCCRELGKHTRALPLRDEVFLEFSVFAGGAYAQRGSLAFLCLKNLLITFHDAPIPNLKNAPAILEEMGLATATIPVLVYALLSAQASQSAYAAETIAGKVNAIDTRMDRDPDSVGFDDILDQKEAVSDLDAVTSEQVTCFDVLGNIKSQALDLAALGDYLQLLTAAAQYNDRISDRLNTRVVDLRQRYEVHQQDKLNKRLAVLTVISAVFLPLTLIAGIWGMNFDKMPELHYAYSYPIALTGMTLLGGGLLWFFYKRGWLS